MLNIFRRGVTSKIMLVILGIGLVAIVVTGFGTGGMGLGDLSAGGSNVASVGGEKIGTTDVADQVNRQLARAREQQPDLDMGTFLRGGALEEIVDQLISATALTVFGTEHGLAASKRMVDGEIASIPAFHNLAGQFDENTFRAALARENVSEQRLREEISGTLLSRQLLLPVAGSPSIPDAMALQYASLLLEQRTGAVGLVPAAAMGAGTEPTDAEVANFYKQSQARYTIPERRVLRFAEFGVDKVAAAAQPTDAEIEAAYKANAAKYGAKETRTLSQVVLPDQAAARALAARIAGGTSFAAAAQQAGFSTADTSVGQQTREQFAELTSPAVAATAFGAAQGATTAPAQSPLGWHVVRVDAVNTVAATPLSAVRGELATQISAQKRERAMGDLVTRIEDALAEGSSMEEVAKAEGLTIRETPPITGSGIQFDDPNFRAPELQPALKTAFDMTVDEDPVVEALVPNQTYTILSVSRIVPAAAPPLAEIKDRVKADFMKQRALERAKAVATAIVAKINAGTAARQAFAEAGRPLPAVESVTARRLDIARPNQQVPPPLAMMFSIPRGKARLLQAPNGEGWFVVHLEKTVPGDARSNQGLLQATRRQFEQLLGEEYATQFGNAVKGGMDIDRNEGAITALRKQLAGPGAQ